MSHALRFALRHVFLRSIASVACAPRNYAALGYNRSFTSKSTFSRPPFETNSRPRTTRNEFKVPQNKPNISSELSRLLVLLENSIKKRGIVYLQTLEEILKTLEERKTLSNSLAVKLIQCCGEIMAREQPLKRIEMVHEMWNSFKEYGVEYSINHYNALLRVYIENEFPFNPPEITKELDAKGLLPDARTYELFIAKYGREGDLKNINRLLSIMREKQISILVDIYSSFVICHAKNGCMKDAENMISIVDKIEPDALPAVLSTLTIEYIKRKEIQRAMEILTHRALKSGYSFNEWFNILYELAVNDYEAEFGRLLEGYKKPGDYNTRVPIYIIKLIVANKPEYAYLILKTMHQLTRNNGTKIHMNPFFISNLVQHDIPSSVIVKVCLDMMKSNNNQLALQIAMHESLRLKNEKLALSLFHAAMSNNLPIRLHYFWPLLLNRAKNKDCDGLFNLLDIMYNHYNLVANSETLRFYIIPFIYSKNMDTVSFMYKFKPYGVTLSTLVGAIVHHLLTIHEFQKAAEVAESYGATYPLNRYEKITVSLYVETKDCQSFVKLMKAYCMGSLWQQLNSRGEEDFNEEDVLFDQRHFFNSMVYAAVEKLMQEKNGAAHVTELFECMLKNNITVSSSTIDTMKEKLFTSEQLDDGLSFILEQMKLKKVTAKLIENDPTAIKNFKSMERLYEDMQVGSETSELSKKYLFNLYAKNHNLEKLLDLKQKLEAENYELTDGMHAYILDALVEHNRWKDALKLYQNRMQNYKNNEQFHLDYLKLSRFASLLVQNDRIEDAYKIISEQRPFPMQNPRRVALATAAYSQLLKSLAKKNDLDQLRAFFELFKTWKFTVTDSILEPLIEIHLLRNDTGAALKEYVECVTHYNYTPCQETLMRALVAEGDKNKLSEFFSASGPLTNLGRVLYDLVIVYSELNKIKEARRVLQSQILKPTLGGTERLTIACEKYFEENNTKNLLNLFFVTRGTTLFERDSLCTKILTTCINTNDVTNARVLWTEMQDENLIPPPGFLHSLGKFFRSNGLSVEFDFAEESNESVVTLKVSSSPQPECVSDTKRK